MITLLVTGALFFAVGVGGNAAWAGQGGCGGQCGGNVACASVGCGGGCVGGGCAGGCCKGRGLFTHAQFVPFVTYYAPYPYWWPKYFGPPYTDYLVVQYVTPPHETALIVKERILAINAGNPALLVAPKVTLPPPQPQPESLPAPQK